MTVTEIRTPPMGPIDAISAGSVPPLSAEFWVDPGTLVPLADQDGSIAAPFSSLQQAHDAVPAESMLRLVGAGFGDLVATKSLTLQGESGRVVFVGALVITDCDLTLVNVQSGAVTIDSSTVVNFVARISTLTSFAASGVGDVSVSFEGMGDPEKFGSNTSSARCFGTVQLLCAGVNALAANCAEFFDNVTLNGAQDFAVIRNSRISGVVTSDEVQLISTTPNGDLNASTQLTIDDWSWSQLQRLGFVATSPVIERICGTWTVPANVTVTLPSMSAGELITATVVVPELVSTITALPLGIHATWGINEGAPQPDLAVLSAWRSNPATGEVSVQFALSNASLGYAGGDVTICLTVAQA